MMAAVMTTLNRLRAFVADERGSVLPIVGLCMLVILGVAALAIDLGYQQALQSQLGATADAAALAAAAELPNTAQAKEAALKYAEFNMPREEHGDVLGPEGIEFGHWDADHRQFLPGGKNPDAVRLTVGRTEAHGNPAQTFFLHLFGLGQADLVAQSMAGISFSMPSDESDPSTWSDAERKRVTEMAHAVDEENKRRMWDKSQKTYDVSRRMTVAEMETFLRSSFGKPVLLQ